MNRPDSSFSESLWAWILGPAIMLGILAAFTLPLETWSFNFRKEPGKKCLDCHVEKNVLMDKRFAHGPFASSPCETCHDPDRIALRAGGSDLCLGCHKPFREDLEKQTVIHYPIREKDCVSCHDPHATDYRYALRAPGASLCKMCHPQIEEQNRLRSRHQPFREGKCLSCHTVHGSTEEYLLRQPPDRLCMTSCHTFEPEELVEKHKGFDVTKQVCSACHHPHASHRDSLVRENNLHPPVARGLCESCHTTDGLQVRLLFPEKIFCDGCHAGFLDEEEVKRTQHSPFQKRECRECHAPHGSQEFGMLRERQPEVCLRCHDELEDLMDDPRAHQPFIRQPCVTCHDPHASNIPGMLNREQSDICFDCHRSEPFTRILYPHPPAEKGNCGFCHDGHGSDHPFLLKRSPSETCLKCHPDPPHVFNHPLVLSATHLVSAGTGSGVGEIRISSSLDRYRDSDGSLSCIACHKAHGGNRPAFLRRPIESGALCFECHSRRDGL